MPWWTRNNLRLIQNNLRDIDVAADIDALIREWESFSCNAVMVGAGGISSFFPTKLPYQRPSPYLKGDFLGELTEKCHQKGIRVFARFDFSKTHESLFPEHPGWYYRSPAGEAIRYHDTVQTCPCGEYQQTLSLNVIREVLESYPVDGVFFNMFGFQTKDYSNRYHGICHCAGCRERFYAYCGEKLPEREDWNDPVYLKYADFKEQITGGILESIHALVQEINPEVAVCTYRHRGADVVRSESNSAVDRPYPFWLYSASENVDAVMGSFPDKIISNCLINATDIFYRFTGVSQELCKIRLYESIASGSGLDFCIIGVFEDYPDRENFPAVQKIFRFHREHEEYFGRFTSCARLTLVKPERPGKEYFGLYRALKEAHLLFDVLREIQLKDRLDSLCSRRVVILPSPECLDGTQARTLMDSGVKLFYTAVTRNAPILSQLGVQFEGTMEETRAGYLSTREKEVFRSFPSRGWVILDRMFGLLHTAAGRELLPLVLPARFGPPERCFGHRPGEHPGALITCQGRAALLPWGVGELYYQYGYEDHKNLFLDLLRFLSDELCPLSTNAPAQVEIFYGGCGEGKKLLQLLNLTGFNGVTFFPPVPLSGLEVTVDCAQEPRNLRMLTQDAAPAWTYEDGKLHLSLPILNDYLALVLEE
ncbi:MAG: hypothetical protein HFG26_08280 [Provencibacterium sp.]|jgi:hypothetical protein|nr:hypothetical protein [Provencibacterium sp.]